jgi:hypothetical protein
MTTVKDKREKAGLHKGNLRTQCRSDTVLAKPEGALEPRLPIGGVLHGTEMARP